MAADKKTFLLALALSLLIGSCQPINDNGASSEDNKAAVGSEKLNLTLPPYSRKNWRHWIDADRDCQNTRAEVLIAGSLDTTAYTNARECTVFTGRWYDPYSNKVWTLASDLDIDHVVPLAWAHAHGASGWSLKKKAAFANDPRNLLAVEDNLNQSKGAKGPDQWLPPNTAYQCEYVIHFDSVVSRYALSYGPSEAVMQQQLADCLK